MFKMSNKNRNKFPQNTRLAIPSHVNFFNFPRRLTLSSTRSGERARCDKLPDRSGRVRRSPVAAWLWHTVTFGESDEHVHVHVLYMYSGR
jgi:hypothetical protein